jgi:hypothetical protein
MPEVTVIRKGEKELPTWPCLGIPKTSSCISALLVTNTVYSAVTPRRAAARLAASNTWGYWEGLAATAWSR